MIITSQLVIACLPLINYATGSDLRGAGRLVRRRMGQQNPPMRTLQCEGLGGMCANFQGRVPGTLLAGADPCAAQKLADEIVTEAKKNPKVTDQLRKEMIEFAKELCQYEHNTHPDYANKNAQRNSLYCQEVPTNDEIDGLFQKQHSENDPQLFWDPSKKGTVKLNEHPGTKPRPSKGGNKGNTTNSDGENKGSAKDSTGDQGKVLLQTGDMGVPKKDVGTDKLILKSSEGGKEDESKGGSKDEGEKGGAKDDGKKDGSKDGGKKDDPKDGGKKDESKDGGKKDDPKDGGKKDESKDGGKKDESKDGGKKDDPKDGDKKDESKDGEKKDDPKDGGKKDESKDGGKKDDPSNPGSLPTNGTSAGKEALISASTLGKCSNPQIKYGPAFEGRKMKDLTFMPVDKETFPQASALNLQIVTRAMCDLLLKCGFKNEDKTIKDCRQLAETIGQSKNDGAGADKWNLAFGFTTNFAAVKPTEQDKNMMT